MSRRSSRADTEADQSIRQCITSNPPRSFVVRAGAGSGKTTSLIKALDSVLACHGALLAHRRQQVACITYTEVAAQEVRKDIGDHPQIFVSTIHSFFWTIIKSFQVDIKIWITKRLEEKIADLHSEASQFSSRTRQSTRDKNQRDLDRITQQQKATEIIYSFRYGSGSDYSRGTLGHDDIIKIATFLLLNRPLFRAVVAQRYPFVFVDESQDTMPEVVEAFKAIERQMRKAFCIGFFGDPIQQIYMSGIGAIPAEDTWIEIDKPENFRNATSILDVANSIRANADGLRQVRGLHEIVDGIPRQVMGTARFFILPLDGDRDEWLWRVRHWTASQNNNPTWATDTPDSVKILVIVHRMAARRLGFGNLYAALNDRAPDSIKLGFLDGTAWPLRPLLSFILPIVEANAKQREFDVISLLRQHCTRLEKNTLRTSNVAEILSDLRKATASLARLIQAGGGSIRDVLELVRAKGLLPLDEKFFRYLDVNIASDSQNQQSENDAEEATLQAFLECPAKGLLAYKTYLEDRSPFSTQQGVKGAEFERVLVVMDDTESQHRQFSYDKYFGIQELSATDLANTDEGRDTVVKRTMRLLYVCCTRARRDLALVLFTSNVNRTKEIIIQKNIVQSANVFVGNDIYNKNSTTDESSHSRLV